MGLLDKPIPYDSYKHCINCTIYISALRQMAAQDPSITMKPINTICPNCMWFIDHILNGDTENTNNCPWYMNANQPYYIQ